MRLIVSVLLGLSAVLCTFPAYANSYLEMLTTAPQGQTETVTPYTSEPAQPSNLKPNWWYDSRITTPSPVVVSPYPRYQAWLKAKANESQSDESHEQIQNMIYMIEGGLLGLGLYEIYKYH